MPQRLDRRMRQAAQNQCHRSSSDMLSWRVEALPLKATCYLHNCGQDLVAGPDRAECNLRLRIVI